MADSGDWITPRLYGQPWFEKPVLYYWCAGAGFGLLNSPEWAARLPSALAALLSALAIAWLAWVFYGLRSAWVCLLIFPTTVAAIGFARAGTPDMLFAAWLAVSMCGAAGIAHRHGALRQLPADAHVSNSSVTDLVLFGGSLGLATLAKGPAAIVLAAGSLGLWIAATSRWRSARHFLHPLAMASFCAIAAPWYVLCALRNSDFLRTFLVLHNFERFVTPVFQHQQPFWFFAPILLMATLPWTALLAKTIYEGWGAFRGDAWKDSPGVFLACWAIFPALFFSFSESKLPGYILSSIPALSILLAVSAVRSFEAESRVNRWIWIGVGLTWVVALAAPVQRMLRFMPRGLQRSESREVYAVLAAAAAAGIVIAILTVLRHRRAALALSAVLTAALVEVAGAGVLPHFDPYLSARATAVAWRTMPDVRQNLQGFDLNRSWLYGLNFYFEKEVSEWSPQDPDGAYVLTNPAGIQELRKTGRSFRVPPMSGVSPQAWEVVVYPK